MSYIDSQLLPGENVVYRSQLHWQVFLAPGLLATLLTAGAVAAFVQGTNAGGFFCLAMAVVSLVPPFLKQSNSEFAVTNKRIVVKLGFFTTRTLELLLTKVEAISVNQGVLGKMLGFGDIIVTGSGGTKETFQAVASPLELRRAVQAATTGAA